MYLGDFKEDDALHFCWSTNDKDGASVAPSVAGTIYVYKDDDAGQSVAGITDTRAFDGLVGIHVCIIDLSSDAFYEVGADYSIVLTASTIDSEVVNAVLATFSIENRFMRGTNSAALASVCTETRLAELDAANLPSDVDDILADTNELQADDYPTSIAAVKAETVLIVEDTNEIQGKLPTNKFMGSSDGANDDGTLNTIAATSIAVLEDTGTTLENRLIAIEVDTNELQTDDIPGKITTAQNDLNLLTGVDGATLATLQGNYAPNVVVPDVAGTAAALHAITDALITALIPIFAAIPLPALSVDTIKTILRIEGTEYDDLITILLPVVEDIVVKYCGVSAVTDLSVGAIFPIAGLVRYAMENPIGAKSQTVGSDKTDYGEFPNALLKLLDNFKPDTTGGYVNAEVINLSDINEDLGK